LQNRIIPIEIDKKLLYIHLRNSKIWISWSDFVNIFSLERREFNSFRRHLQINTHYIEEHLQNCNYKTENSHILISKRGIYQIAYRLESEISLKIVDFFEELNFECNNEETSLLNEVETLLRDRLDEIKNKKVPFSEIEEFLTLLTTLLKQKRELNGNSNNSLKQIFIDLFEESIKGSYKKTQ